MPNSPVFADFANFDGFDGFEGHFGVFGAPGPLFRDLVHFVSCKPGVVYRELRANEAFPGLEGTLS